MNPRGCILVMCSSDAEVQEPVIYMVTTVAAYYLGFVQSFSIYISLLLQPVHF